MIIPLGSDKSLERVPWITYFLIAIQGAVFLGITQTAEPETWLRDWGCQAAHFTWLTCLTSTFLHGDFIHLFGNMLYLWLYGGDLEDRLGKFRYLLFYLSTGLIAGLIQVQTTAPAFREIPTVGASGAISAILGAYTVLFPWAKIRYWFFSLVYQRVFSVWATRGLFPLAWVTMGFWFLGQGMSHMDLREAGVSDGIAYAAHAGGFLAGAVVALALLLSGQVEADWGPRRASPLGPSVNPTPDPVQSPCPACLQGLRPLRLPSLTVQECRECAGIWAPRASLEALLVLPRLPNSLVYLSPQQRACSRSERNSWCCPGCNGPLLDWSLATVVVQGCPHCQSAFLDSRRLQEWGLVQEDG